LVLRQLGEGRKMLERLREAEVIAEQLRDDRRLGQVCALMATVHSTLGELDEALAIGTRGLDIAQRLGDLRVRIVAASHLEQAHYYRGEYEHTVESASNSLAALPADWAHENFGMTALPSVFGRAHLIMSLAELGRFAEAARYEAEATRFAESSEHVFTIGWAHFGASMLHLVQGDWAKARLRVERWIAMLRTANVAMLLPWAVAASAWALAQSGEASEALDRIREAEQLLECEAARGIVAYGGWAYGAVGRACLLLGQLDAARRLGDRSVASSRRQSGFTAHALRLLGDIAIDANGFDAETGEAYYGEALALANRQRMRPLAAHCHLGLGRLYRRAGNTEHTHHCLTIAKIMYREMEMGFWVNQAEAEIMKAGDAGHIQPAAEVLNVRC